MLHVNQSSNAHYQSSLLINKGKSHVVCCRIFDRTANCKQNNRKHQQLTSNCQCAACSNCLACSLAQPAASIN
jgi:hypothetical protein